MSRQLLMTEWHGLPGTYFRASLAEQKLGHVRVVSRDYPMGAGEEYRSDQIKVPEGWAIIQQWHEPNASGYRFTRPGGEAFLLLIGGGSRLSVKLAVGATSLENSDSFAKELLEALPKPKGPEQESQEERRTINVRFDVASGKSVILNLPCLPWAEIRDNYHGEAQSSLDRLASMTGPTEEGRVIVFHGPPGTGKTYALQSILGAWSKWADIRSLADRRLVTSGEYLLDQIVSTSDRHAYVSDDDDDDDVEKRQSEDSSGCFRAPDVRKLSKARALVLVAEDVHPLLSIEGGTETDWSGISNVLEMGDGMMSRARPVYLFLTANLPVAKFNKAIERPGRCLAKVKVDPFPRDLAAEWLKRHGVEPWDAEMDRTGPGMRPGQDSGISLAELYQRLRG